MPYTAFSSNEPLMTFNGHFWFRESTQEWVFEVEFCIPDYIISIERYTGNTRLEALQCFQELFPESLNESIQSIQDFI